MEILRRKKAGFSSRWFLLLIITAGWILGAQGVWADEISATDASDDDKKAQEQVCQMAPVTVTAQKRTENVQDVPDGITVLNEVEIQDAGITDMVSLSTHVPNLEFYDFGSRWHNQTYIRGIKSLPNSEPSTGYYVDGVNYSKSYMFAFPLFDVERIEVLRGPQGTLYGRNTMAGVINVHTKMPDNELSAGLSGSIGSYKSRQLKGYARSPIITDKLFFGLAGLVSASDGYMENDVSGVGEDGRYQDGAAGRMKLRLLPTPKWDISISLDGQQHDDGAFPFRRTERNAYVKNGILGADEAYHYAHDFPGTSENDYWGMALNANVDTAWGRLTAISGYRDFDSEDFIDSDFSSLDAARMQYRIKERSFSQELRLTSTEKQGGAAWLAGLYYFHIDENKARTNYYRSAMAGSPGNPFRPGTGARLTDTDGLNEGAALFGQVTYPIRKTLDLTLGLRYEVENAEMDAAIHDTPDGGGTTTSVQPTMDNDFSAWLPKLSLAWHYPSGQMLYATFSRAHRSGGFNTPDVGGKPYDEEYSWVYEIGSKSSLLDNRLTLNIAGFYTDIEDEQITRFNEYNQSYLENAGASHRIGVEAEARFAILQGLELTASLGWLEAQYDRYSDPTTGDDYEGNTVFGVPDYNFSAGLQYRRPLWGAWNGFGRVEVSGVGRRYFDDANTVRDSPYELINLKLGLEGRHWDGYLWADNLFDRQYRIFENVDRGITEDGKPFAVGMSLAYRF
jgi:iron complex outermembrane receptor protein